MWRDRLLGDRDQVRSQTRVVGPPLTFGLEPEELLRNGRVPCDGHGEPGAPASEPEVEGSRYKRRKEQFDPLLRRVDVTVFLRKTVDEPEKADSKDPATVQLVPLPKK